VTLVHRDVLLAALKEDVVHAKLDGFKVQTLLLQEIQLYAHYVLQIAVLVQMQVQDFVTLVFQLEPIITVSPCN